MHMFMCMEDPLGFEPHRNKGTLGAIEICLTHVGHCLNS